MKTKCYSVRVESMRRISDKCYSARSFDGREALIPASQVYGPDLEVSKSEAWWITAWILEKKDLQYSTKKEAFFYTDTGKRAPEVTIEVHLPEPIVPKHVEPDASLIR
jgi:hypothetical protein